MSRLRTPTALAALATVALAGCGGSHPKPPAHDATRGMAPLAAVEQGFAKLRARPSRMDLSMDIGYDTGGLSSELKQAFASRGVHAKESMEIAGERRANATMDVGPVHGGKIVLYDGTVYFSKDGRQFKQVTGQLGQLFSSLGAMSRQLSGKSFAGVRYVGYEDDGKHYAGALSAAAKQGMESLSAAQGAPGTRRRSSHEGTATSWADLLG
jgi:hypothetical protein